MLLRKESNVNNIYDILMLILITLLMKLFKHSPISIPQCILDETNNTHIYHSPTGKKLRSVTTMINKTKPEADKKNLNNWRNRIGHDVANYIMNHAKIIGTETHKLNENYINMEIDSCNYSLLSHAHHRNFIPYINKISNVYAVEPKLYSDEMNLAGMADWVGIYHGKLSIGDFKTKRSSQKEEWMDDYFIQTTAYSKMWKDITGQDIEQLVILVSSEQNTIQEFISRPEKHYNSLANRLTLFHN